MRTTIAVVALLAVFAGVFYYAFQMDVAHGVAAPEPEAPVSTGQQSEVPSTTPVTEAAPAPRYTNNIQACQAPDGSTVYTNASDCDLVDHSQRVSVIPTPKQPATRSAQSPARRAPTPTKSAPSRQNVQKCGRTSLHLAVPNPRDVPQSCKWSWGRAQELERMIGAAKEPKESIWMEEYCERIREVISSECRLDAEGFCYEQYCWGR